MRRWYFRDGLSQREITRRAGLSRNTVRRYLNNDITESIYPKRDSLGKVKASCSLQYLDAPETKYK